jgi:hypothetical protein
MMRLIAGMALCLCFLYGCSGNDNVKSSPNKVEFSKPATDAGGSTTKKGVDQPMTVD